MKTGFKVGDKIVYRTVTGERIVGKITAIFPPEGMRFFEEYEIVFTTNRARTYRKGEKIRTSGAWLNKR